MKNLRWIPVRVLVACGALGGGCVGTPPAGLETPGRFVPTANFSGTYAFVDLATSERSGGPAENGGGPHAALVPLGRLQSHSSVLVTHQPGLLAFTYRLKDGTIATRVYDPASEPAAWRGNQLVFSWVSQILLFGVVSSDSAVGLLDDRRLVLSSAASQAGLYLAVPINRRNASVATLAPAPQEDTGLRRAFDEALAVRQRALAGEAGAQIQMARTFVAGNWTGASIAWECEQAAVWMLRAANQNNADAQCAMGALCGSNKNLRRESIAWYRRAAANGHVEATHRLGTSLSLGSAADKVEGLRWLRLAANAGYVLSQLWLGDILSSGAVPQDAVEACFWYQLIGVAGDAYYRTQAEKLAATLTSDQRAAVERRVREWKPTPLPRADAVPAPTTPGTPPVSRP